MRLPRTVGSGGDTAVVDDDSDVTPSRPMAPAPAAGQLGGPMVLPHEADPGRDATRWGVPPTDYETPADGSSAWMPPSAGPGAAPPLLPGVAGPHTAAGWLMRGREATG